MKYIYYYFIDRGIVPFQNYDGGLVMPYYVRKSGDDWVVAKRKSGKLGKVFGRHKTKSKAERQRRALYASTHNESLSSPQRRKLLQ